MKIVNHYLVKGRAILSDQKESWLNKTFRSLKAAYDCYNDFVKEAGMTLSYIYLIVPSTGEVLMYEER